MNGHSNVRSAVNWHDHFRKAAAVLDLCGCNSGGWQRAMSCNPMSGASPWNRHLYLMEGICIAPCRTSDEIVQFEVPIATFLLLVARR